MVVHSGASPLTELADAIRCVEEPLARWADVDATFVGWADTLGRRARLRAYLRDLPSDEAARVLARSKEATTHFAWCLLDRPGDAFSLWLHEYKPARDWLPGYANSVHNHRYHFSTAVLAGGYLHERFAADLDADGTEIRAVRRTDRAACRTGWSGSVLSHEFHRIPHAEDGTLTFLVKSRMVRPWSVSLDPGTGLSQRHIPMGSRLVDLAGRL